jgi:hypothetical protein
MRFVHLKKYIGDKPALVDRASGFPDLQRYIVDATPDRGE